MTGHQPALPGLEPGEVLGQLTVFDVAPPAPARAGCPIAPPGRPRCHQTWRDDRTPVGNLPHDCARPPDHPLPHICTCGEVWRLKVKGADDARSA